MKNEKDTRCELDSIRFRFQCGVCALAAIYDAMENGQNAAECYADGVHGVWDYLDNLVKEIDENVSALFSQNRKEEQA